MTEISGEEKTLLHRNIGLIVAAGRGVRAGGGLPKQYRPLAGQPVLRHTLRNFLDCKGIDAVLVVIHPDDRAFYELAIEGLDMSRLLPPVPGGASRQESVRCGLEALSRQDPQPLRVLIHDAARAMVSPTLIRRVLNAIDETAGAVPALALHDTIKESDETGACVVRTLPRERLWRAQTPQGFPFAAILAAHRATTGRSLTDDAAVAEAVGMPVHLVEGDERNFKITEPADFARAERLLAEKAGTIASHAVAMPREEIRVGTGFDVHRFGAGDHVMLCGLAIPHDQGLAGHSDADVALHAVTDALLGAIAAGDIGSHFPPSDERWRGAPSDHFVRHALDLLAVLGGRLVHCDLTIIGERPKIGPHRSALRRRLTEILGTEMSRVSIKATTTEQLGFAGRGEGLAAQAAVSVALPASDRPGTGNVPAA
ncbi:MAG: bifunctional 2-C-methyl-D-erythritol 4-phosphate cytidylyltransferase/2-C-methyl-D-erythritol 2,4-cyclodiphosphate synthase [Alphaproteobacteria bacterium]|nr:MAG: bifunctional 2-C-methyl-D-erythritol 4-phosphate cytidylyltransferase/2-C-methyl-D-erythritol 2,4-cyclodiphosphate synthase [Alphaproteobacteria bacterium]